MTRSVARSSIAVCVLTVLSAGALCAQMDFQASDLRELSRYALTVERVRALTDGIRALCNLAQKDPGAIKSMATEKAETLSESVTRLEGNAIVAKALKDAGLTVKDYVIGTVALAQAYNAADLKKSGLAYSDQFPVPPENVAFVESHPSEISAVMREVERFSQLAGQ